MEGILFVIALTIAALKDPIMLVGIFLVGVFARSWTQVAAIGAVWGAAAIGMTAYLYDASQLTFSGQIAAGIFLAAVAGSSAIWAVKRMIQKARAE